MHNIVKMEHTCQICGVKFNANYETVDDLLLPVYRDSHINLKIYVGKSVRVISADICPKCSNNIHNFLNDMMWTVNGLKFSQCDFCKHHKKVNLYCNNCYRFNRFEKKEKLGKIDSIAFERLKQHLIF